MVRISGSISCAAEDERSVNGVNLLPSTGEFTYDTLPISGSGDGDGAEFDQSLCQWGRLRDGRDDEYSMRSTIFRRKFRAARRSRSSSPGSAIRRMSPPARFVRSPSYQRVAFSKRPAAQITGAAGPDEPSPH